MMQIWTFLMTVILTAGLESLEGGSSEILSEASEKSLDQIQKYQDADPLNEPMEIQIQSLTINDAQQVFELVFRLLQELGEEAEDLGPLQSEKVLQEWREADCRFLVMVAKDQQGTVLGFMTLSEAFALYANGNYGIINELFVVPEYRSTGVGAALLEAAKGIGRDRCWMRIDVTAPEGEQWVRSKRFYEKNGFKFAGPKLKLVI